MVTLHGLLAYIGPETFLPITSIFATLAGLVLMFWRTGLQILRRAMDRQRPRLASQRLPQPHLARTPSPQATPHAKNSLAGTGAESNDA